MAYSYLFGFSLWLMCALIVFDAWGPAAVILGLFTFDIGVLPALVIFMPGIPMVAISRNRYCWDRRAWCSTARATAC